MVVNSHYVATGYVYDSKTDRFLLILHKKSGKWLAPGGHLDKGEEPHKGVLREVLEETGTQGRIIDLLETPQVGSRAAAQLPSPFCILHELITSEVEGEEHVHIDFVYVIEINVSEPLTLHAKEVSLARWVFSEDIDFMDTYENVKQVCHAISAINQRRKTWEMR